jgi:hypothetical protein
LLPTWIVAPTLLAIVSLVTGCQKSSAQVAPNLPVSTASVPSYSYRVFAMNRRGMSFPDNDFSVSAIFPPANFIVAQVVATSSDPAVMPKLLDNSQVELRYVAVANDNGSITTTSIGKTNFWTYADKLYDFYVAGSFLAKPDQGVHGLKTEPQWMPGKGNSHQAFTRFDQATATFTAPYVPITPIDDQGNKNHFPLFRIEAVDKVTNKVLASTVVPLPVADPMRCELCHATGGVAADAATSQRFGGLSWSGNPDAPNNGKENIAILHSLVAGIDLTMRKPYLCAECHYSAIADPDGVGPQGDYQIRRNPLSVSIHAWHSLGRDRRLPVDGSQPLLPEAGEASCKICHGGEQPYTRGPMHQQGMVCQDCHGGLMAMGKSPLVGASQSRKPFADEPRCESCHTGDNVSHLGQELVLHTAYEKGDPYATPRVAVNRRFADSPGTLYRNSLGHGGMTCISCHGSPHAEWPVEPGQTHDNEIAIQLQGHAGSIAECSACHGTLPLTTAGPHGLHNINDLGWVTQHGRFYKVDKAGACQTCHGTDLKGSRLSRVRAAREFALPNSTSIKYAMEQVVGCADCHAMP